MGSQGMKRSRKGGKRRHLEKAGTHHESVGAARHEQELERSAVADVMGLGNTPGWVKFGCLLVGFIIVIAGVVTLISLD
jgi:hypothetical protein